MSITYQAFGDKAILVQWEQRIDPAINAEVVHLCRAIEQAGIDGVDYCLPAYCSLTVGFQPGRISYTELSERIRSLIGQAVPMIRDSSRKVTIPVCYQGDFAPDLEWMSEHTGLSREQVVQLHTATPFPGIYAGLLPGFPYMGLLPKVLNAPRKPAPRLRVPEGSVALAGLQTGIYPLESPGGWQIIGRTPVKVFDPGRAEPFLFQAGDEVHFEAIEIDVFERLLGPGTPG